MKYFSLLCAVVLVQLTQAQSKCVAITIDDVPNVFKDKSGDALLQKIDSMSLPVAAFINEGLLYKTKTAEANFSLLNAWVKNVNVTLGSHTFNHPYYSEVGIDSFCNDVKKGLCITKELAKMQHKSLDYFRFPYNDMGADSVQHMRARAFLLSQKLTSTPFTIESSDWMFNAIYEHHLKHNKNEEAREIGEAYVSATLKKFEWIDALTVAQYGRRIKHIYLCHDNAINAAYLPEIVSCLADDGYRFISLNEAMQDEVYAQVDSYYKKWGISWVYRWIKNPKERRAAMQKEPDVMKYHRMHEKLSL